MIVINTELHKECVRFFFNPDNLGMLMIWGSINWLI